MRYVTADTVQQDNETYRRFLEPNGWILKEGDFLVTRFAKDDNLVVSASVLKQDGATIYFVPSEFSIARSLTVSGTWGVKNGKVRLLGDTPLRVKADSYSSYGPIKLFGPENFDVRFDNKQLKFGLVCNTEGMLKNHIIQFDCGKNGTFHFSGFDIGGGCFSGLRLCERGHTTDATYVNKVSGVVENFSIHNTLSEGIYAGSVKKFHTKLNVGIRNGKIFNAGSEALQAQNFGGDLSIIEKLTIVNTACEFPTPFQNFQVGGIQVKAGGGNLKIRDIYIENGGMPVFNIFASAPVYDLDGTLIQEGSKPGDTIEFDNIYSPSSKGHFVYMQNSCSNGATWIFDNIYCGGVNQRINIDTQTKGPHAFLNDVFSQVTDTILVKNITTDGSLPLIGKYGAKYNVQNHTIAQIPFAKFKKPYPGKDVLALYNVYNEVSQTQFYPVAGQPIKYKKDDLVFKNTIHNFTEWKLITEDCDTTNLKSEPITFTTDYDQADDSPLLGIVGHTQTIKTIEEQLREELMILQERLSLIITEAEAAKAEAAELQQVASNLEAALASETQANAEVKAKYGYLVEAITALVADLKAQGIIA